MRSTNRFVALAMVGLTASAVGCAPEDAGLAEGYTTVPAGHCTVDGAGAIGPDAFGGALADTSGTLMGTWSHTSPAGGLEATSLTFLECRLNGSRAATIRGRGTWNGVPDHYFTIVAQDLGGASPPARLHGTPETVTLTATRTYSPSRWTDGDASWEDGAEVVIPDALPVTVGNAGNQWSRLTFVDYHSAEPIRCSYRGGASTANPRTPADIARGESYDFAFCERWVCDDTASAHGCDGCDWERDPALVPGVSIDSSSVEAHVQHGSSRFPDRDHAQTTIAVDLGVTPYIETPGLADKYKLTVFPPDAGPAIYEVSGDLTSGDLTVHFD